MRHVRESSRAPCARTCRRGNRRISASACASAPISFSNCLRDGWFGVRRVGDLSRQRTPIAARSEPTRRVEHVLAVIERLRGRVELEREHVAEILGHLEHVPHLVRAHRDMIFGVRAGRNRIDRCRMRARGQIVDQCRRGVLHDHEAGIGRILVADQERGQTVARRRIDELVDAPLGDRRQHWNRRLDVAHRERDRHAVEVAGRDDLILDDLRVLRIGKDQRIVGDRIELDVDRRGTPAPAHRARRRALAECNAGNTRPAAGASCRP